VRRALLGTIVLTLGCLALPAVAAAEPCPPFDGTMSFQAIHGPEDSEDYCWEVNLGEEQELRQVDDQHAEVVYTDGQHVALSIAAGAAHDAEGTAVPTTIEVVQPNLIFFTVHHRAGNPAAGGAPFLYPISQGEGWEGGFQTFVVTMPPTEQGPPAGPPTPICEVPVLQSRTLKAARRALLRAGCSLGPIRGERRRGARVVKQYRLVGKTLPAGTAVGVKLGR
jgi:hypothetical protein